MHAITSSTSSQENLPQLQNNKANIYPTMSLASSIFDAWEYPFQTLRSPSDSSAIGNIRIDWKETPKAHVFKADLPGLSKNDVKLEVSDGRILQISGERKGEEAGEGDKWHCAERGSGGGRFLRRLRLPEDAVVDKIKARMEDGVLTVTVPKEEEKKGNARRSVEISGGGGEGKSKVKKKGVFCCGIGGG